MGSYTVTWLSLRGLIQRQASGHMTSTESRWYWKEGGKILRSHFGSVWRLQPLLSTGVCVDDTLFQSSLLVLLWPLFLKKEATSSKVSLQCTQWSCISLLTKIPHICVCLCECVRMCVCTHMHICTMAYMWWSEEKFIEFLSVPFGSGDCTQVTRLVASVLPWSRFSGPHFFLKVVWRVPWFFTTIHELQPRKFNAYFLCSKDQGLVCGRLPQFFSYLIHDVLSPHSSLSRRLFHEGNLLKCLDKE